MEGSNSAIINCNLLTGLFQAYFTKIFVETVIPAGKCCFNAFYDIFADGERGRRKRKDEEEWAKGQRFRGEEGEGRRKDEV